jgi:hypothetical protein
MIELGAKLVRTSGQPSHCRVASRPHMAIDEYFMGLEPVLEALLRAIANQNE